MLLPVSKDAVNLALLEAFEGHSLSQDPLPLQQAYLLLQNNLRLLMDVLDGLGFTVAKKQGDPQLADIGKVISAFSAGKQHVPYLTVQLRDNWPVLYDALTALVDNLQAGATPNAEA